MLNKAFKRKKTESRLRVNKALFFILDDSYFASNYSKINNTLEQSEQVKVDDGDDIQRTIEFLPAVIGQCRNGGFWQVFFNGYGEHIPKSLPGLKQLGLDDIVNILELVYKNEETLNASEDKPNKAKDFKLPSGKTKEELAQINHDFIMSSFIFEEEFKNKLQEEGLTSEVLTSSMFRVDEQALHQVVKYMKQHAYDYILDEVGNELDPNFTGTYSNKSDFEKTENYELPMVNGKPHGECRVYELDNPEHLKCVAHFENGEVKTIQEYYKGNLVNETNYSNYPKYKTKTEFYPNGSKEEQKSELLYVFPSKYINKHIKWYENGNLKRVKVFEKPSSFFTPKIDTSFYENGQKEREVFYDEDGKETIYRWYESGQISSEPVFDEHNNKIQQKSYFKSGKTQYITDVKNENQSLITEFFETGQIKQKTMKDNKSSLLIERYEEDGTALIIDGNGFDIVDKNSNYEIRNEYQNGIKTGFVKQLKNGKLVAEYYEVDNKRHGLFKSYDEDGLLQDATMYNMGVKCE